VLALVNVRELTLGSSAIFARGPPICASRRSSRAAPRRRFRCEPDVVLEAAARGADLQKDLDELLAVLAAPST
jgi:hypothetical protein